MRIWICLTLALSTNCTADLDISPQAVIRCHTDEQCPSGFTCRAAIDRCVSTDISDTTPPGIVAGSVTITPSNVALQQSVVVRFEVTEELALTPRLEASRGDTVLDFAFVSQDELVYGFSHQLALTDAEGDYGLTVDLYDSFGNANIDLDLGHFAYDGTAPSVLDSHLEYVPAPGNPLLAEELVAATAGTEIHVTVVADEALGSFGEQALSVVSGDEPVQLTPRATADATSVLFVTTVDATLADGTYDTELTLVDRAGNAASALQGPQLVVRQSAGQLAVQQSAVVLVRSPWGNAAEESLGTVTLPSGPFFELSPSSPLADVTTIPADTFTFLDGGAITRVQVWATDESSGLLAEIAPTEAGDWPRTSLADAGTAVWITGVDGAGNSSTAVRIENAEWVATLNGTIGDDGPFRLDERALTGASLQDISTRVTRDDEVAGWDGSASTVEFEPVFHQRLPGSEAPSARERHGMVYDVARGVIVMFGGAGNDGVFGDLWEWDRQWHRRVVLGDAPSARSGHAMAYHSARSAVVVFGGRDSEGVYNDLWEWDGVIWRKRTPAGSVPPARHLAAMAAQPSTGRILVFGGERADGTKLDDCWLWDGTAWTEVAVPSRLTPRSAHVMGYDPALDVVILHGGDDGTGELDDTWIWNGAGWAEATSVSAPPSARRGHTMTYDSKLGALVLAGGYPVVDQDDSTYLWNGSTWQAYPANSNSPIRVRHAAMAHHAALGTTLFFGGRESTDAILRGYALQLDPVGWSQAPDPNEWPSSARGAALACHPTETACYLLGGQERGSTDLRSQFFRWDGLGWTNLGAGGNATGRRDSVMMWEPTYSRFIVYGGYYFGFDEPMYRWTSAAGWLNITPARNPGDRDQHAMAWDSGRGRAVLFGDVNDSLWEWNGSSWADRTPAKGVRPTLRTWPAMAYDARRGVVVMFGGSDGGTPLDELWEWDGDGGFGGAGIWTLVTPGRGDPWPEPRYDHRMVYDPNREVVLLFGGQATGSYLGDLWEWNGTRWRERTLAGTPPAARAGSGMAYDTSRDTLLVYGGNTGSGGLYPYSDGLWEARFDPGSTPALHAEVDLHEGGFPLHAITRIRVRAVCGGNWAPLGASDHGAQLVVWQTYGIPTAPRWTAVGSSKAVPTSPALLDWTTAGTESGLEYVQAATGTLSAQCRLPDRKLSSDGQVSMDYFEVRVRYQTE